MRKYAPFTLDQCKQIEDLIKKKMSCEKIAYIMDCSSTRIKREIRKKGGFFNYSAEGTVPIVIKPATVILPVIKNRPGRTYKTFSEEQIKIIREKAAEGMLPTPISRLLKVARGRVNKWLDDNKIAYKKRVYRQSLFYKITEMELQLKKITQILEEIKNDSKNH